MISRTYRGWLRYGATAVVAGAAACAVLVADVPDAEACGCLSPPVPDPVSEEAYAVNQQAEQIIFEVADGEVSAHVLIRYAGDPAQFAWILPVPVPPTELALSESVAFGLIDDSTAPVINVGRESLCPSPEYVCTQHPAPTGCSDPSNVDAGAPGAGTGGSGGGFNGAAGSAGSGSNAPPPVTIIDRAQIGGYDTVTFGAGDAAAAIAWLQGEGFIVNDTMTPFMQGYVDAGMVFVAAKLIPGADVDQIRPLKIRYPGTEPMIPLKLTAVAAEPHLTVTAYIYSDQAYEPVDHPLVGLDPRWISLGADNRVNYPMVMARAADDAGGDGFVMEYAGLPPTPSFGDTTGCCGSSFDSCFIGGDGACQCPLDDFDAADCADEEDLVNGVKLVDELSQKYAFMTRLSTRLSAEEMSFDPAFRASADPASLSGRLTLSSTMKTMQACEADIVDEGLYESINELQPCAAVYCGEGECVATANGPGCACNPGFVGRRFNDLDGQPSVTCVPATPPVDFAAAGITLPDACKGVDCGNGSCVDVGGFPTCNCRGASAAVLGASDRAPTCEAIERASEIRGARDFTAKMEDVRACAPAPDNSCGEFGWLVPNENKSRQGVVCVSSIPDDPRRFEVPPKPTCEDYYGPGGPGSPGGPFDPRNPFNPFKPGEGQGGTGAGTGNGANGDRSGDGVTASGGACSVNRAGGATGLGLLGLVVGAGLWARRRRR